MTKQPVSDLRQLSVNELAVDQLDNVTGGHGVTPPPPGFDTPDSGGDSASSKAKWNRVAQQIDPHNTTISK